MDKRGHLVIIWILMVLLVIFSLGFADWAENLFNAEKIGLAPDDFQDIFVAPDGSDVTGDGTISKPYATLEKARDDIRDNYQPLTTAVNVFLRGGTYYFTTPFVLDDSVGDSGTVDYPINYTSYLEEDVRISGGRQITGWTEWSQNLYYASASWDFNSLFVDGQRAIRAREPDIGEGYYTIQPYPAGYGGDRLNDFYFLGEDLDFTWSHLADANNNAEVVALRRWVQSRMRISNIDNVNKIVRFTGPIDSFSPYDYGAEMGDNPLNAYYIENFPEAMDSDTEWYLDKINNVIWYYSTNQNPANLNFVAPVTNQLISLEDVNYLTFQGLSLEYTDWGMDDTGHPGMWGGMKIKDPPMIMFENTENIIFRNNKISHTGAYGIEGHCSQNIFIKENEIFDIGGGGIRVGEFADNYPTVCNGYTHQTKNNIIEDNTIYDGGKIYLDSLALAVLFNGDNIVSHNLIYNMPYIGIAIGHNLCDASFSHMKNNKVSYNEVYDVMQVLNDGGAIYIQGNQPGSEMKNNIFHDILPTSKHHDTDAIYGIYLDWATRGFEIRDNLVYRADEGLIRLHRVFDNTIENNIFIDGVKAQLILLGYNVNEDFYLGETLCIGMGEGNIFQRNIFFNGAGYTPLIYSLDQDLAPGNLNPSLSISDYNLFYPQMHSLVGGFDTNSQIGNPEFVDYANDDFNLKVNSPAYDLGFQDIDLDTVGPRICGNEKCEAWESCSNCESDCGACSTVKTCGDGIMNLDEIGIDCGGVCSDCTDNSILVNITPEDEPEEGAEENKTGEGIDETAGENLFNRLFGGGDDEDVGTGEEGETEDSWIRHNARILIFGGIMIVLSFMGVGVFFLIKYQSKH